MDAHFLFTLVLGFAWIFGVISWILTVIEMIAMWRLSPWAFRLGYPLVRRSLLFSPPQLLRASDEPIDIGDARLRLLGPFECIFRRRFMWFSFELHTPFPLKCTLRWEGTQAVVTARIPIGTTGFLAAWLLGWCTSGLLAAKAGPAGPGLDFFLLPLLAVVGVCIFSLWLERRRAEALIADVSAFLTRGAV